MPISDEKIMQQLMSTFKAEADEHLEALNKHLLDLEKNSTGDHKSILEEVFREAHSLKGAARSVEAGAIETTAHGIETVFAAAKRRELELKPVHFDLLYEGLDYMKAALVALAEGVDAPDHSGLLARLDRTAQPAGSSVEKTAAPANKPETAAGQPNGSSDSTTASQKTKKNKSKGIEETVRVSTRKLDALMTHVEELLVSKIRTEQRISELKDLKGALQEWQKSWFKHRGAYDSLRRQPRDEMAELLSFLGENQENLKQLWSNTNHLLQDFSKDSMRMSLITEDLQEDIRRVRMLPVASIFEGYKRMVRDLARAQNKQINLQLAGSQTELDKKLIEGIKDPLMHIIRNSIDHGIEAPAVRTAAKKAATGTIKLSAGQHGNTIKVEIEDDGAGLDIDKIKAAAVNKGVISEQEAGALSDEDARLMIFQSGFSTADKVTNVSGRGIGLDVVKTNIEKLNGLVHVSASPGGGTRFTFNLPLPVATARVLLIEPAGETYAIPTTAVERIIRVAHDEIFTVGDQNVIRVADRSISLVGVRDVLEVPDDGELPAPGKLPVIILGAAEKRVAFAVDSLLGETEIVIKSLGKMMSRVRNVSGATILGSGQVVMILNVGDMIKSARQAKRRSAPAPKTPTPDVLNEKKVVAVLVVDDSITTRIMEKNILESAGYQVSLANDGVEALETLRHNHFDLVVSDVDMPRMNGFELTAHVKESEGLQNLPVVLVTALDSAADKERGLECGADAYIVKRSFDQQNLLDTIEQLV